MFNEPVTTTGKHAYGNLAEFPFFFGTVLFALEAIGVVSSFFSIWHIENTFYIYLSLSLLFRCDSIQIMPLENEMKTPKSFGGNFGVLNKSMIAIIFLYVGMGFFGYLKYGDQIAGSITLNLPQDKL